MSEPQVVELHYQVVDLPVRIRCADPLVAERLADLLEPFRIEESAAVTGPKTFSLLEENRGSWILRRSGDSIAESDTWTTLIGTLVAEVNTSAVAAMRCFAAHAGVVADADGAVAFPAESGGGKSTLTAACLIGGFDYVSDEALCLDFEDGKVVPYPKPIGLTPWSMRALELSGPDTRPETMLMPQELGAVAARDKMPLRDVVLMERAAGAFDLSELPRSQLVASLLGVSFNHYKRPEESFRLLTELARTCRVWRLRFDDPSAAAQLIRDHIVRL